MESHDTPPYLRGAKFKVFDPERDLVGDHESWPRRYTVGMALAFLGIVAVMLLYFKFGIWR